MYAHISFNDQNNYGRMFRRLLQQMEDGDALMIDVRDMMTQMIDGDGSQDVHYARLTTLFGFENDAKSHAAFNELDSAFSKTSGDGTVDHVFSARQQLYAKLRG